jgi:ketosteroid isomerase-like protein
MPIMAKRLMILALGLLSAPAAASDAAANAVYDRMIAAHRALDTTQLETVYAPGATYLSRNGRFDIHSRPTILRGSKGFHDAFRANGGSVDIKIRLVERKRFGDIYVDNGYVRSTYISAKGAAPTVTTGKFATVLARQPSGSWAIVTDADSEAPAAAFDSAVPPAGLKFDQ